jgi:hypothetical protein
MAGGLVVMVLILRRWAGWLVSWSRCRSRLAGHPRGVNYGSHVRGRRRPSIQRAFGRPRGISGLDRLSLRSGHRFTIGESFRSRLWFEVNGALAIPP